MIIQALDWLYLNYWYPAAHPSTTLPPLPLEPLQTLFTSYKSLTKIYLRDVSKTSSTKPELSNVLKNIERWINEVGGNGSRKERALNGVIDVFLDVGGLVPTARKCVQFIEPRPWGIADPVYTI